MSDNAQNNSASPNIPVRPLSAISHIRGRLGADNPNEAWPAPSSSQSEGRDKRQPLFITAYFGEIDGDGVAQKSWWRFKSSTKKLTHYGLFVPEARSDSTGTLIRVKRSQPWQILRKPQLEARKHNTKDSATLGGKHLIPDVLVMVKWVEDAAEKAEERFKRDGRGGITGNKDEVWCREVLNQLREARPEEISEESINEAKDWLNRVNNRSGKDFENPQVMNTENSCPVCFKDLSPLLEENRRLHINRCWNADYRRLSRNDQFATTAGVETIKVGMGALGTAFNGFIQGEMGGNSGNGGFF